jgi:hypothetical protein
VKTIEICENEKSNKFAFEKSFIRMMEMQKRLIVIEKRRKEML